MATASLNPAEQELISIETYLRSSFEHDCDYIDGHLEERPAGEFEHSRIQIMLAYLFTANEAAWNIYAVTECRLQVAPTRFRIPDVMVLSREHTPVRIVRTAPILCIEVVSPEDTWKRLRARVDDYRNLGVEHVWIFDPEARQAYTCDATGFHLVAESVLTVAGTPIHITLAEVFSALPPTASV